MLVKPTPQPWSQPYTIAIIKPIILLNLASKIYRRVGVKTLANSSTFAANYNGKRSITEIDKKLLRTNY